MDKEATKKLFKKAAAQLRYLDGENKTHEKKARALKLLYKQAEMGIAPVPDNYPELEEKLASLTTQNLDVLEEAMKLAGGRLGLGDLEDNDLTNPNNPEDAFAASVIGNN